MNATLDIQSLKAVIAAQGITQSGLAKISGVSRAQLVRLLKGDRPRVHQSTLERLAKALTVDTAHLLPGGVLNRFKESLAKEHRDVDFRGIGMPRIQWEPIEDVFVDLAVQEITQKDDECRPTDVFSHTSVRQASQPIPATECIRTRDRVVVLGNPGSGKTTLLRFLTQSYATRNDADGEIPIYIRLPELCRAKELDEQVDPVKFVAACATDRDPGRAEVERSLREVLQDDKRRCLVLLDGLDEVGNQEQKERLIECVQTFIERYPRNRFAITSRVVGFESGPWRSQGFAVFRILGYHEKQLRSFAEKWAKIVSRHKNKPYSEVLKTLQTAVFGNPRVRALASNPLILTILVLLSEARGGALPRRRVDLYQKVVDVFLDTWESSKRSVREFDDTHGIDLDAREFRWLLSDLSAAMQKADRTLAPRWWIADRMQSCLQHKLGFALEEAKEACDGIIRYLTQRTGLLQERGLGLFGFSHRTLQEYFASLGVIDEADASSSRDVTDCLRGYYFHPQWSEVVRLAAAQLAPPVAESLVSAILDDPDPVGRFLRRGQLLALKCLADGTTVANRRLVESVFDSLVDLGKSRWLGVTLDAIDVLEGFQATRLQNRAKETLAAVLETAEKELDDREYDCLFERVNAREIFESAQDELSAAIKSEAAREVTVAFGDRKCLVTFLNGELLLEDPETWYSSVCSLLEDPRQSTRLKEVLVSELGRRIATDPRSRHRLRKMLRSPAEASIRAACASALAGATKGKHSTKRLLLKVLDQDRDEEVRSACAMALRDVVVDDASVRRRLMEILDGEQPAGVRSGAARGLEKAAVCQPSVLESLQRFASLNGEADEVKTSCAWALGPQIGKDAEVTETFKSWLDAPDGPKHQRIAAQTLAMAMADEKLPWDHEVVEKVEHVLMSLDPPCPHALESLDELATAREIRRGLRLENVLRDSLRPLADRIELAFVFGSTARNRQTEESDIDLLVMGEVDLKGLSGPLREAERTLGRRINPVIYTQDSFRQKYQAGNPFLLDVYRREKIPVMTPKGVSSQKDLDDELRAMVAEQLASKT